MMFRCLGILLILCGVHWAQGQKVKVEYNPDENFAGFKNYSWIIQDYYQRPILAMHIVGAVDEQLQAKGLQRVENAGDLVVAAYGAIDNDLNVAYRQEIYSMPGLSGPVWWANGMWIPGSSSAVYIKKGTLVVDIADPQLKRLKWRGVAHANLDSQNPKKSLDLINKSVEKMFRKYPAAR